LARNAVIQKVNPYELHGVRYFQILLTYEDTPDRINEVRLAHDMVYAEPAEGDSVKVEALLSVVTGIARREP
jgi:hypothetical protein